MTIYRTMTPGGIYGAPVEADNDDDAMTAARALGYDPIDITCMNVDEPVIIVCARRR